MDTWKFRNQSGGVLFQTNSAISIPEPNLNNLESLLDKLRTSFQTRDSGDFFILKNATLVIHRSVSQQLQKTLSSTIRTPAVS